MSTSKKKTPIKAPEAKAKYSNGATVFYIIYHRGKPEEIAECKVTAQHTSRTKQKDFLGKVGADDVYFSYTLDMPPGASLYVIGRNLPERDLYPNFTEAAKVFAKAFLLLLK
jgi:hypothetical protein